MLSKVVVVPEEEFRQWYFNESPNAPLPGSKLTASSQPAPGPNDPAGLAVLKSKTCLTCHSVDGKTMVGPTFKGAFGAKETVVEGGADREVVVDEEFLRAEIRTPSARILKGYPPSMPAVPLTDGEVKDVVEYIKSLKASS
jgi:cytochrome c oxidase subunit 2